MSIDKFFIHILLLVFCLLYFYFLFTYETIVLFEIINFNDDISNHTQIDYHENNNNNYDILFIKIKFLMGFILFFVVVIHKMIRLCGNNNI